MNSGRNCLQSLPCFPGYPEGAGRKQAESRQVGDLRSSEFVSHGTLPMWSMVTNYLLAAKVQIVTSQQTEQPLSFFLGILFRPCKGQRVLRNFALSLLRQCIDGPLLGHREPPMSLEDSLCQKPLSVPGLMAPSVSQRICVKAQPKPWCLAATHLAAAKLSALEAGGPCASAKCWSLSSYACSHFLLAFSLSPALHLLCILWVCVY